MRLVAILLLLLLNAVFVAAEFALARCKRSRLETMMRRGDRQARIALQATASVTRILPASQLGITLSSLALGWLAADTAARLVAGAAAADGGIPEVSPAVVASATGAILLLGLIHVAFAELVPRAIGLAHPENVARWLAPPLVLFARIATPFLWIIDRVAAFALRPLGKRASAEEEAARSPEELRLLVEQSQEWGELDPQDAYLLEGVFEFSEKNAGEVMTPRPDIIAIPIGASLDEAVAVVEEAGRSRYPVYDESIDDIEGIVLAKDLLPVLRHPPPDFSLRSIMRRVHMVPASREVEEVLGDFKRLKEHMAIVLDEYGGTAGLVTMEDLLEEIVGEILDEYDEPEPVASARGEDALISGSTHIGELNERFGLGIPEEEYNTVGGYVFGTLGRLPAIGDRVSVSGAVFTVREMTGRRIETLDVDLHSAGDRRAPEPATREAPAGDRRAGGG
ncbi:MAG: hemolysin family protein [Gemmatimonadaceae bacterium]